MSQKLKRFLSPHYRPLLILIFVGEIIFFLPFVLARVFRPTVLKVFELTNYELGSCFSAYGVVAMISYVFGGYLADRFQAKHLMAIGLWTTSAGGFYAVSIPSYEGMLFLYGYWGFTTIFLFWASMIRATREWGGNNRQGKAFGLLEGGRGLVAAVVGVIAVTFFAWSAKGAGAYAPIRNRESFQIILVLTSVLVFSAGLIAYYGLPNSKKAVRKRLHFVKPSEIMRLLRLPTVWLQAIMIVCAYVGYKITDDYSLFANEVLELDQVKSAGVATVAIWLRPAFAIAAGFLADRFLPERVISWCFAFMCVSGALIYSGWYSGIAYIAFTILTTALVGVYGLRGVYFAVMNRGHIPLALTGTAVGIISLVGYTPDVFISPIMGHILDTHPGVRGHELVFGLMSAFGLLGFLCSLAFGSITNKLTARRGHRQATA